MSDFQITRYAPSWFHDDGGCVEILHTQDETKDAVIKQYNYSLTDEEICKVYEHLQDNPELGKECSVNRERDVRFANGKSVKLDDIPEAKEKNLLKQLQNKEYETSAWVGGLKKGALRGKFVLIDEPLRLESRAKYADLFRKNFDNWAKETHENGGKLDTVILNSICYAKPTEGKILDANAAINPLLKGHFVEAGSVNGDFVERLTDVVKGNPKIDVLLEEPDKYEYKAISKTPAINGVPVCYFSEDEFTALKTAARMGKLRGKIGKEKVADLNKNSVHRDYGRELKPTIIKKLGSLFAEYSKGNKR